VAHLTIALAGLLYYLLGDAEQLLAKLVGGRADVSKAEQHFKMQQHLNNTTLLGPEAPQVKERQVIEAQVHALLVSNISTPGCADVLEACQPAHLNLPASQTDVLTAVVDSKQDADSSTTLLRLERSTAAAISAIISTATSSSHACSDTQKRSCRTANQPSQRPAHQQPQQSETLLL
jgi:hypothetical protein